MKSCQSFLLYQFPVELQGVNKLHCNTGQNMQKVFYRLHLF